jgi:beta-lactamase regulating signal transducer with metallopeptidase domain
VIVRFMIYCIAISFLLALAGLALERLAVWRGKQRRLIWALALGMAIVLPAARTVLSRQDALAAHFKIETTLTRAGDVDAKEPLLARMPHATFISDKAVGLAWVLGSLSLAVYYFLVAAQLKRNARRWLPAHIDGHAFWVTDSIGPAVYGLFRPKILVPRWILDSPASSRTAILHHEQEHIRAHDNLLLMFGLVVVLIAPWNIPLWWQFRRLRFSIEVDCDARVVAEGVDMQSYARALLSVAEQRNLNPIGALGIAEPTSQLMQRIQIMTTSPGHRSLWVVFGAVSLLLACVSTAAQLIPPELNVNVQYGASTGKSVSAVEREAPDVVFQVIFMKDGEYLASPTVVGKFGQEVRLEIPNVMRVSTFAEAPNHEGLSFTSARMAVYQNGTWQPAKEMTMQAHLSLTPSFEYSVPDTPYRFVVMPRRIVPAANQKRT